MDKKNDIAEIERARTEYAGIRSVLMNKDFLNDPDRKERRRKVRGVMADYGCMPRVSGDENKIGNSSTDSNIDVEQLVTHCEDFGVNCFEFLIGRRSTDWQDFQDFAMRAEQSKTLMDRNFSIWIYLVPPSEFDQLPMEPYRMDYVRWMMEVALLSQKHPVVTAVCIDDFYDGGKLFSQDYLTRMRDAADRFNPGLALVTVYYWGEVNPERELRIYREAAMVGPFIDGILYAFADQSSSPREFNHHNIDTLPQEVQCVKELYPHVPVILDIYVSKHSQSPDKPSAAYVGGLIDLTRETCDGVACYGAPKKNKDGTFPEFFDKSMESPSGIFEVIRDKFGHQGHFHRNTTGQGVCVQMHSTGT